MPFAVKDVLQHKRNERQIREIHEREYLKYVSNLRDQQQQQQQQSSAHQMSHIPSQHAVEVERARKRNVLTKQHEYERINRENRVLFDRLLKASRRTMVDDRNPAYEKQLDSFSSKRFQQRWKEFKRIDGENQLLERRFNNARSQLIDKQQCDDDWQRHLTFMKKTCDYPENIDRFVSKSNSNERRRSCTVATMKSAAWDERHSAIRQPSRFAVTPLRMMLIGYE